MDKMLWDKYGYHEKKNIQFETLIKDKSYQYKLDHPNVDCERNVQTTRTASNVTKSGSAIDTKSFQ
jgi:hypothetical protein